MKYLTRSIWLLALVSLFTDMASEMLYPVMPLYMDQIGISIAFIGILEGIAQAIASLSKGYFGALSDKMGKRARFVRAGYSLSAIAKPLMVLIPHPLWILGSRTLDRLGKGVRTGARDAILSGESGKENRGKVFGFHRGFDTLGAVIGPVIGMIWLFYHPSDYKPVFYFAIIPGFLAILFTFLLKEKPLATKSSNRPGLIAFLRFPFNHRNKNYKRLIMGLFIFALINSSDFFLLLLMKEKGLSELKIIGMYVGFNFIYALLAFPMGALGDKIGLKPTYLMGILVFGLVYAGMSQATEEWMFWLLFGGYGLFGAATEGVAKAWISRTLDPEHMATGIGALGTFVSLGALIASIWAGALWEWKGPAMVFGITAIGAFLSLAYLFFFTKTSNNL